MGREHPFEKPIASFSIKNTFMSSVIVSILVSVPISVFTSYPLTAVLEKSRGFGVIAKGCPVFDSLIVFSVFPHSLGCCVWWLVFPFWKG